MYHKSYNPASSPTLQFLHYPLYYRECHKIGDVAAKCVFIVGFLIEIPTLTMTVLRGKVGFIL